MKKKEYMIPQLSVVVIPKHEALMAGSLTEGNNRYLLQQEEPEENYEIDEEDFG
ncbi:MAG: hypothetical protein IKN75_10625 [Prevotella sp.]|nr:hypothetical protein [Prevotella sp.]